MTLDQIIEEARSWPAEKICELVDRLSQQLNAADSDLETAWKQEARRRLAEIESGSVEAVDAAAVSARIRKILGL